MPRAASAAGAQLRGSRGDVPREQLGGLGSRIGGLGRGGGGGNWGDGGWGGGGFCWEVWIWELGGLGCVLLPMLACVALTGRAWG